MWIILALISAIGQAGRLAVSKKLTDNFGAAALNWLMLIFSVPFMLVFVAPKFVSVPLDNPKFLIATLVAMTGFTVGNILIIKATELAPLSITVPFLAFTPVPAILIEFLVMGTLPTVYGAIGILLIAIGSYTLNASESKKGLLEPIKAIFKNKGSALALLAAFVFSIGGTIDKYGIDLSDPMSYLTTWLIFGLILNTTIIIVGRKCKIWKNYKKIKKYFPNMVVMGFLFFITIISNFMANALTNASYVLAVKRTSAFFSVLIGWLIFKEIKIRERAIGSLIMVAGVVLISVLG